MIVNIGNVSSFSEKKCKYYIQLKLINILDIERKMH